MIKICSQVDCDVQLINNKDEENCSNNILNNVINSLKKIIYLIILCKYYFYINRPKYSFRLIQILSINLTLTFGLYGQSCLHYSVSV